MTRKNLIFNIIRLLRPRQWIKNLAIFAAVTFSGNLFEYFIFYQVLTGFIIFCLVSSSVYIINDIFDIEKDRLHPFKKNRPIAKGDISVRVALGIAVVLVCAALYFALSMPVAFIILLCSYIILQIAYSVILKHIAVIDILAIAAGYILRVYAGEFASGFHISVWLLLTTIAISLFLAIGKRRSELTLISGYPQSQVAATRKTLSHYSERLLDVYASIFATSTFIAYSLFSFFEYPTGVKISLGILLPEFLPDFLQQKKWLMVTILPVVYGLMRYLQDIYEKHEGESPEKVLLSDTPLLTTVMGWIVLVILIIYVLG